MTTAKSISAADQSAAEEPTQLADSQQEPAASQRQREELAVSQREHEELAASQRQLQELSEALRRVARGDLKVRLPRRAGLAGEVADAFNDVVATQERQHLDVRRIARIVGRDGRLTERLDEEGYDGSWAESQRAINSLIDDLGRPTTEIARVIVAVADGDLSQHMALRDGRPPAAR